MENHGLTPGVSKRPKTQQAKPKKASPGDHFQTPGSALEPLKPYLLPHWTIWEPAAGTGNLVRTLERWGHPVVASDTAEDPEQDFLTWTPAETVNCIVTNPPYSIKDAWLERCFELDLPFALLLPYTIFEAKPRQELFRRHHVEAVFLDHRPKFRTPSGKEGGSWFPCLWLTFGLGIGQQLNFCGGPR